jgi:hypothetical protein
MKQRVKSRARRSAIAIALVVVGGTAIAATAATGAAPKKFADLSEPKLGVLSQGARMWFERPQAAGDQPRSLALPKFGTNVDANDPNRDFAAGQSETAIAAAGDHVLVAWNDATSFVFTDSTLRRASGTGVGYSADGAKTFTDLIGLPNSDRNEVWQGDPSIVSLGDGKHFIVGSLYFPSQEAFFAGPDVACPRGPVEFDVAVSVATVKSPKQVDFTLPIIVARSKDLCAFSNDQDLLDKPFMSYNAASQTLAVSYARARFFGGGGRVEVKRATHVSAAFPIPSFGTRKIIWPEEATVVNTGAYPAVANNGDIYVAWERNIDSNLFSVDPYVYIHVARLPHGASSPDIGGLNNPRVVTKGQTNSSPGGGVKSLDGTPIAGYNRGLGQDFPRIAYDPTRNQVVVEWNDASHHPLGDIFLRALNANLNLSGSQIRQVNDDNAFALHFLPAVSVRSDGAIVSSWYDRRRTGADSTVTDYFAEVRPAAGTGTSDFRVTTGATDWAGTSSFIFPNFGDYTDNTSTGNKTYFTWSDGRIGVPQPFVDSH